MLTRPLFRAHWTEVLFLHLEVDPTHLQKLVPYEIDLFNGRGFVSLVTFQMRETRPIVGGRTIPVRLPTMNHAFLNLRTYVRDRGEPGIFFLAEWVPSRISVVLGPRLYGLPYRLGTFRSTFDSADRRFELEVESAGHSATPRRRAHDPPPRFRCRGTFENPGTRADTDSALTEFLVERYTAFTARGSVRRRFRIEHDPWSLLPMQAQILDDSLYQPWIPRNHGPRIEGAHYSPGVFDVALSAPRRID